MAVDLGLFKRHPVASIAGGLLVFIVIYYLSSGGSSSASSSGSGGVYGYNANDLQYLSLQAAQSAQANQLGAQVQVATLQAQVQSEGIQAQVQQNDDSLAASLASIQAQTAASIANTASNNQTQVDLATVQTNAQTTQVQLQAQENEAQTAALANIFTTQAQQQTQQQANQLDYLSTVANDQAYVAGQGQQDATQVALAQIQEQNNTVGTVAKSLPQVHNSAYVASILDSLLNQPSVGVATLGEAASTNNATTSAIGGGISTLLAGLLA